MPHYCVMDDGWPKKRCKVTKAKLGGCKCRHWLKGITENGCGPGMWKVTAKDGEYDSVFSAPEYSISNSNSISPKSQLSKDNLSGCVSDNKEE